MVSSNLGPRIPLRVVDDSRAVVYDRRAREPDAVLYSFVEEPRVMPATAHGSNAWRHFKLDVARLRSTNGLSSMAKYAGQCARAAALSRFAASDADFGPDFLIAARVEGLLRLQGADEQQQEPSEDDRPPELGSSAVVDPKGEECDAGTTTTDAPRRHHSPADNRADNGRSTSLQQGAFFEERLRQIEALKEELPQSQQQPGAPTTSVARLRWNAMSVPARSASARASATLLVDDPAASIPAPSAQWRSASASHAPIEIQAPTPIPVNHDDAEDQRIASMIAQLASAPITAGQQRRRDALRSCAEELTRRTSECRLSIAAVLLEAVSLKRSHARIAEVCSASVASSEFAEELRDLLRGQLTASNDTA